MSFLSHVFQLVREDQHSKDREVRVFVRSTLLAPLPLTDSDIDVGSHSDRKHLHAACWSFLISCVPGVNQGETELGSGMLKKGWNK